MVKAYLIGQISVTNPEGYGLYASKVPQTIADAGGRYVVRGGHATQVEGQSLGDRNVVIEFPSRDAAQAWYDGPAYQAILVEPTELTKKMMPHFRNMVRSACHETWSAGTGLGGEVVVLRCAPKPGQAQAARDFIAKGLYPQFAKANCLVRLALWEASST